MSSFFNESINLLSALKVILILAIIIFICKNIFYNFLFIIVSILYCKLKKKFCKITQKEKPVKTIEDYKKIYALTKCNTLVNRDLLDKRNYYLRKVKNEYNDIYGEKGLKYFQNMQKENQKPKTNKKVTFSGDIQYSN